MFNLEQSIADWRQRMLAAGIQTPVPLEELEGHLREEIDRQMRSGMNAQRAFEATVEQMGRANLLKCEFKKIESTWERKIGIIAVLIGVAGTLRVMAKHHDEGRNDVTGGILFSAIIIFFGLNLWFFGASPNRNVRLWKLAGMIYSIAAAWISLLPLLIFLEQPKYNAAFGLADRIFAGAAIAVTVFSVFGWQWCGKILPVIGNRRTRTAIGIAGCVTGPVLMALFIVFMVPHLGSFPAPLFFVLISWLWAAMAVLGGVGYGLAEAARRQTETAD